MIQYTLTDLRWRAFCIWLCHFYHVVADCSSLSSCINTVCYLLIFAESQEALGDMTISRESDLQNVLFRLQALHLLLPRQLSTWLRKNVKNHNCKTTAKEHRHREAFSYSSFHRLSQQNPRTQAPIHQPVDLCPTCTISFQSYSISFTSSQMSEHESRDRTDKNKQETHKKTLVLDILHHWIYKMQNWIYLSCDLQFILLLRTMYSGKMESWDRMGPMVSHIILFGHQNPACNVT